ncbi:MAG: methylenetetrahydrofolate reductase [Nocardioidaceae bacterium]
MRNNHQPLQDVLDNALRHAHYELLPTAKAEGVVLENVPTDITITVTASPAKGLEATLDLAERLTKQGYQVTPHLAARMISGRAELREIVDRLTSVGVTNVFCPAGDADPPAGEYAGTLALLQHLTEMGSPFDEVGITGYPETHPSIQDDVAIQSMWDKRAYATYMVSNLCLDPDTIAEWLRRVRKRGVDLPLLIGLPGPLERTKLLSMATRIGVSQSIGFLRSHLGTFARIATPGGFRLERFLQKSATLLADPTANVAGLHFFTFNQVTAAESWRQSYLADRP